MMHCVSVTHHIPFLLASVETSSVCKVRKDFISLIHVNKGHLGHVESVLYSEEPPIQWNNALLRQTYCRFCYTGVLCSDSPF